MPPKASGGLRSCFRPGDEQKIWLVILRLYFHGFRAHPSAPNKPPYETLAGFLQAPIDKLKDYFATFPSSDEKQEAKKSLT